MRDVLAVVSNRPQGINFIALDREAAASRLACLVGDPRIDHSGGLCDINDFLGRGEAFIAYQGGEELAVIVLSKIKRANGFELEVRAALQISDRGDLTETVLPAIERAFAGDCAGMTIYTRRAGLVAKLEKAGWNEAAKIMRKALK